MKKYLLQQGLCHRSDYAKAVGIETPAMLDAFFLKAQAYIQYEEKEVAHTARDSRQQEDAKYTKHEEESHRGPEKRKEDKSHDARDYKGPPGKFHEYTQLNVFRERILTEYTNFEFQTTKVCFPKKLPTRPNMDKSKYCRFHKSHMHNTVDCIHLKEAIEILIQEGHLKQYAKKKETP